ncbi:MAG: hypothetical protein KA020_14755 [Planctomycetes bacterium]|nr:hypothetical protein [Planctomycetota bacterium]
MSDFERFTTEQGEAMSRLLRLVVDRGWVGFTMTFGEGEGRWDVEILTCREKIAVRKCYSLNEAVDRLEAGDHP